MRKAKKRQGKISCEVCGQSRERCFEVHLGRERHVFDSFECAMRGLMPKCTQCGTLILGPGVQGNNLLYCSAPCASLAGVRKLEARAILRERANF